MSTEAATETKSTTKAPTAEATTPKKPAPKKPAPKNKLMIEVYTPETSKPVVLTFDTPGQARQAFVRLSRGSIGGQGIICSAGTDVHVFRNISRLKLSGELFAQLNI